MWTQTWQLFLCLGIPTWLPWQHKKSLYLLIAPCWDTSKFQIQIVCRASVITFRIIFCGQGLSDGAYISQQEDLNKIKGRVSPHIMCRPIQSLPSVLQSPIWAQEAIFKGSFEVLNNYFNLLLHFLGQWYVFRCLGGRVWGSQRRTLCYIQANSHGLHITHPQICFKASCQLTLLINPAVIAQSRHRKWKQMKPQRYEILQKVGLLLLFASHKRRWWMYIDVIRAWN